MDGALQRINKVAQRCLPDQPHHLSISSTARFQDPPGFWYDGISSRLQYMTYLSDADRGLLLTRPSYEIRDDTDVKSVSSSFNATRPADVKKPVNKMSFKDYQTKKKPSPSPAVEEARARADDMVVDSRDAMGDRQGRNLNGESGRSDKYRQDMRKEASAPQINGNLSSHLNSSRSPLAETRKRGPEADDELRPPKRNKGAEDGSSKGESRRIGGPSSPRQAGAERGSSTSKEPKAATGQSARNGRAALDVDKTKNLTPSPKPTIRVNGVRVSSEARPSKQAVPPLLSPLRLALDDDNDDNDAAPGARKRPAEGGSDMRKSGHGEGSTPGAAVAKKKPPFRIPPLLSPTLPPMVELELAELARLKHTPSKDDSSQRSSQASESPSSARKARVPLGHERHDSTPSLVVALRYKKKNVQRVLRLLALPPAHKNHNDAKRDQKFRKDRSASAEVTPPPAAKKSLATAAVTSSLPRRDTPSWAKPGRPTTPLKNAGAPAMSRVASSNSQAHTPGDATGDAMAASQTPGTADKRPVSSDDTEQSDATRTANMRTLQRRHEEYTKLGTKVKHSRDDLVRARQRADGGAGASGSAGLSPAEEKQAAALSLEMILAYMVGFSAHNQARLLDHKAPKYSLWEDLLPHFHEIRRRTRHLAPPLHCISLQLTAICLGELNDCYAAHDVAAVAPRMWKNTKRFKETWTEAHDRVAAVRDSDMRARDLGPWTTADEAAAEALRILRRWAEREKVDWSAEIALPPAAANGA